MLRKTLGIKDLIHKQQSFQTIEIIPLACVVRDNSSRNRHNCFQKCSNILNACRKQVNVGFMFV